METAILNKDDLWNNSTISFTRYLASYRGRNNFDRNQSTNNVGRKVSIEKLDKLIPNRDYKLLFRPEYFKDVYDEYCQKWVVTCGEPTYIMDCTQVSRDELLLYIKQAIEENPYGRYIALECCDNRDGIQRSNVFINYNHYNTFDGTYFNPVDVYE